MTPSPFGGFFTLTIGRMTLSELIPFPTRPARRRGTFRMELHTDPYCSGDPAWVVDVAGADNLPDAMNAVKARYPAYFVGIVAGECATY